ncbi:MAG TPA: DNA recombination protein RmuC, partial [Thermoanaerobaculia bacterium]|nr:DNA recombination protein RmuC [Thermoanaerobaculia bacterium]
FYGTCDHSGMTITVFFICGIALILGAIVGWVAGSARKSAEAQRALAERDLARAERERSDAARGEMQRRVEEAQQARAIADTRAAEAQKLLANHEQLRKEIEGSFAALAQKAFKDVGESLVQTNRTQVGGALDTKKAEIETLLTPVRQMLEHYRTEVLKSEHARNESYGGLQEQIRTLLAAQESAQREASRLANALQSPTVRGSWGENSLKRCVELAGMSEFCDFDVQQTFNTEEGRRIRPDLIVRLPNKRVIAVDSKAPLAEYAEASNETDEGRKRELLAAHAKTLRRHIDSLSRREYQASVGETLDFTVMYLPGEHFLSAALVTDATLFEYAVDRKIYLASPTVLLPLLRAIAAGWKAERTEENAKKMHDAGVELFNRFVKVMEHLAGVGKALQGTVEKYNAAIGSIDRMLWPKGEELQRMAQSGKEMKNLDQIELLPLESTKLRLTMQSEEPGVVVKMRES